MTDAKQTLIDELQSFALMRVRTAISKLQNSFIGGRRLIINRLTPLLTSIDVFIKVK